MEFWRLSATEIAALVRRRGASAREVARDALSRLDAVNPALNAVVDHRPEEVLAEADAVDAALARGEDPGPLAGVPVTTKVNADQRGFATTNGLRLQKDLIAAEDSPVIANLRRAGAVLLGRTNTPAFSLRWFTDNSLHGATRNPHDPALTPGGSSGGAAAGLAAGIGALAHGTDIAGSIRYPAYACGLHGLRPSLGRVPAFNATAAERAIGGQIMAVSGPIARRIADLRLGLAAMAQPDWRDPWWVPTPLEGPPLPRRAALCIAPEGLHTAPEVAGALLDAAARLRDAGWEVEEVALPPLREPCAIQLLLWLAESRANEAAILREGDAAATSIFQAMLNLSAPPDLAAFQAALARRATLVRQWQGFLREWPVALMPVSAELPFPDGLDLTDFPRVMEAQITQGGLPLLGLPGLTVTTGRHGRVPVGVQLVGPRHREDILLDAGEAIEARGPAIQPIDPVAA